MARGGEKKNIRSRIIWKVEKKRSKKIRKTSGLQRRKRRKILGEGKYLVRGGEEERGRERGKISRRRKVMTDRRTNRISSCRLDPI